MNTVCYLCGNRKSVFTLDFMTEGEGNELAPAKMPLCEHCIDAVNAIAKPQIERFFNELMAHFTAEIDKIRQEINITAKMLVKEYANWDAKFNQDCEAGYSTYCSHNCIHFVECTHKTRMAELADQLMGMME